MSTLAQDYEALERLAKFPKGQSADPAKNMTPEQKAKWDAMNDEHGGKFKKALDGLALLSMGVTANGLPVNAVDRDLVALERFALVDTIDRAAMSQRGKIIEDQLGGWGALRMMLGAYYRQYLPNGYEFGFPNKSRSKGNHVKITLKADDTYDVEFFNTIWAKAGRFRLPGDSKLVKKFRGAYAEDLEKMFRDQTGWSLRLATDQVATIGMGQPRPTPDHVGEDDEDGMFAKFDEGESADPTENMSEEDAKKWRLENLKHKDQFTKGKEAGDEFKALGQEVAQGLTRALKRKVTYAGQQPGVVTWMVKGKNPQHLVSLGVNPENGYARFSLFSGGRFLTNREVFNAGLPLGSPAMVRAVQKAYMDRPMWKGRPGKNLAEWLDDQGGKEAGQFDAPLRVFNSQHPYHKDLDLIASQRRTLIGTGRFDIDGRRAGALVKAGLVEITEGSFGEELELTRKGRMSLDNSEDAFGKLATFEEGARIPDGWDAGHIEGDPEATKSDEGSDIPDGQDNQFKRARGGDIVNMFALIHNGKRLLGATDNWNDARTRSYWSFGDRKLLDDDQMDQAVVVELYGVPLDIAEKLMDVGTRASKLSPEAAVRLAKPFIKATNRVGSSGLDCQFYKATDGKWYMELEDDSRRDEYNAYGPFRSLDEADRFLGKNFQNPGGSMEDDSGTSPPPRNAINPSRMRRQRYASTGKEARTGLYGHTKRVQADCETSIRKVQKAAQSIAKGAYGKNGKVAEFLSAHSSRADSLPAQILVAALGEIGPKVATEMKRTARLEELRLARGAGGYEFTDPRGRSEILFDSDLREQFGQGHEVWKVLPKLRRNQEHTLSDGWTIRKRGSGDSNEALRLKAKQAAPRGKAQAARPLPRTPGDFDVTDSRGRTTYYTRQDIDEGFGPHHEITKALDRLRPGQTYEAKDGWKFKKIAAPRGKAQIAIASHISGWKKGQSADLTDIARAATLRGVHFAKIMSAAEALKKQGTIDFDGVKVTKKAGSIYHAPLDEQVSYVLAQLAQSGNQGERMDHLPRDGAREALRLGLAKADRGQLYPNSQAIRQYRHAKVSDSDSQGEGIKQTSDKTASGAVNARYLASIPAPKKTMILKAVAKHYGVSVREMESELVDRDAEELYEYLAFDNRLAMQVYREFQNGRFASNKTAARKYGLYGHSEKVAKLGLGACSEVRASAGRIAYDLHRRRSGKHAKITEFLDTHCKTAECRYAKLLHSSYPDATSKVAAIQEPRSVAAWLTWED
jgi:hypothetical protein